jgi:hypothetical protein
MVFPASATQRQSPSLPIKHPHDKKSQTAAVTTVAGPGINGATEHTRESSNSPTTSQPLRFCIKRSLKSVNKRIDEGKNDEARAILEEIDRYLKTKIHLKNCLAPALYYLGLAYTYPVGSKERTENAANAYQALKLVCQNNEAWKTFDEVKKSKAYCDLRTCYERLKPLVPENEIDALSEIDQKIAECNPHILPLEAFNAKVYEADRCVRQKNHEKAGRLYTAALKLIEGESGRNFMIPKVLCILKLANICEAPDMKLGLSTTAKATLFEIYKTIEAFFNADLTNKTDVYKQLHFCFLELAKLFPETETLTQLEIRYRIEECQKEFTPEPPTPLPKTHRASSTTHPTAGSSETAGPGKTQRKYTQGSSGNGSWGMGRIFAALVFAAVAVAAGFAFYRRHIFKVD